MAQKIKVWTEVVILALARVLNEQDFSDALSQLIKRRLSISFMKNHHFFTSTERNLVPQ
jgi:hypothetical protein